MKWLNFVRRFKSNSNVVNLSDYTPKKERRYHCSICNKKVKSIVHYATSQGNVTGVCSSCKSLAEHRGMLPI